MRRDYLVILLLLLLPFGIINGQDNTPVPLDALETITVDNASGLRELLVLKEDDAEVRQVVFNTDGTLMAYTTNKSLNLWDVTTQTSRWNVSSEYGGAVKFSLDSSHLAVFMNSNLFLWDVADSSQSIALHSPTQGEIHGITDLAFVENRNELVAVRAKGGGLGRWVADSGEFISEYSFNEFVPAQYSILSSDGTLNVLSRVHSLELRNTTRGDIRNRIQLDELLNLDPSQSNAFVTPLAISWDNQTLLISLIFPDISLPDWVVWVSSGGDLTRQLENNHGKISTGTFSPDGKLTALGNQENGEIYILNTETGEAITTLTGHKDWVTTLAFSPDGTLLASGGTDGTVRLWGVPGE